MPSPVMSMTSTVGSTAAVNVHTPTGQQPGILVVLSSAVPITPSGPSGSVGRGLVVLSWNVPVVLTAALHLSLLGFGSAPGSVLGSPTPHAPNMTKLAIRDPAFRMSPS